MWKNICCYEVVDEALEMMGYSYWLLVMSAAEYLQTPLAQLVDVSSLRAIFSGETFCRASQVVTTVGVIHSYVGGTGIALMRLLFIKYPLRMPFEPMTTALMITGTTVTTTLVASYFWHVSPKTSLGLASICLGTPEKLDLAIYHISLGSAKPTTILLLVCIGFGFVLVELAIYVILCIHLIQQNKLVRLVLEESTIKKRNRQIFVKFWSNFVNFVGMWSNLNKKMWNFVKILIFFGKIQF